MSAAATRRLLGDLAPADFLARFWHKDARLIRGAIEDFAGLFTRAQLQALAQRDDVESRLVVRDGRQWSLRHGPFRPSDWRQLPARNWTLLVQGTNLHDARADALLRRFAFVPYARLDDLMVSYAAAGGGVGPHVDSYDVFLLQCDGQRRWRWSRQQDLALDPRSPLKILRRFAPTESAVLGPGDMLYLPPHVAHEGVAVDPCTTYSIGFRAPSATELAEAFLDFIRDELALEGRYADPGLAATRTPARIGTEMQRRVADTLAKIRWNRALAARFLGTWLTEPKPHVFFEPPAAPLSRAAFIARASRAGVTLDLRTQLLYDDAHVFANGSADAWPAGGAAELARLADGRALSAADCARLPRSAATLVYRWYRDGYLHVAAH